MSTASTKCGRWHRIARETIPRFFTVNQAKSIGYELCFVTCGRGVYDVVNLKLEVPTLKGALEKTPLHMTFEVTSTEQQDITKFHNEVRALIREN